MGATNKHIHIYKHKVRYASKNNSTQHKTRLQQLIFIIKQNVIKIQKQKQIVKTVKKTYINKNYKNQITTQKNLIKQKKTCYVAKKSLRFFFSLLFSIFATYSTYLCVLSSATYSFILTSFCCLISLHHRPFFSMQSNSEFIEVGNSFSTHKQKRKNLV